MPAPNHYRYWPKGLPHTIRVPQVPLTHYLQHAAACFPDKPAIIFGGAALSYADLSERVDALAGFLRQRLGVQPGDRVLLVSQNCPQFVVAFFGALRAGAVVVPVNAMSTQSELRFYIEDSGARVAIAAQELLAPVRGNLAPECEHGLAAVLVHAYSDAISHDRDGEDLPDNVRAPRMALADDRLFGFEDALALHLAPPPEQPGPNDLCVLPYTSGTAGHPKGCRHSHATLVAANIGAHLWRGLHEESVILGVAPLFHMLGMQAGMNLPIILGATVVMLPRWNAAAVARLIERHGISAWSAPPAMLVEFFAHPETQQRNLDSLAVLAGGGAAMPEAVAARLRDQFGIGYNEAYGMTETAAFLLANPLSRGKMQCLGVPTFGVEVRVIDPVTLQEVAPGEVGELIVHGQQIMLGYWRNEKANAEAFIERDGKRFLRTGDLVSVDEDGYYFMRDRLKRMIAASGYKVWPAEVESLMYEHPAVQEACVIGVPDAKRGETVKVLIVLNPALATEVTEQDIIDWSRERMAVYKTPRIVEFVETLPKSNTGKIQWRLIQEAHRVVQE